MTLRHLTIFVTVCDAGTLTAAGKSLYMAQPAVSLAISELESHYGVHLFDRISNRLHLTETGKQFQQYAQHILSLYDEMEHVIMDSGSLGTLRIGSSITIANCFLSTYIHKLKQQYPQLTITSTVQNSYAIETMVINNTIDIGLIEGNTHNPHLQVLPILQDRLVFIAPPNHPFATSNHIALEDLQGKDFLLRETGSASREIFDGLLETYALSVNPIMQSVSTQALIRGVENGLGLSILPYLLVRNLIESGSISMFEIADHSLVRNFSIIHHKSKFLSKSARDFIHICEQTTL